MLHMNTQTKTLALATCLALAAGSLFTLHAQDATPRPHGGGGPGAAGGGLLRGPGFDSLSQDEKDKLKAAMEKAVQDPKVKEARDKAEAAGKELRDAVQAAAVAADPTVEPILKKLQDAREKAHGAHPAGDAPKQ